MTNLNQEFIHRGAATISPVAIEDVLGEILGVRVGLAIAFANTDCGEEIGAYIIVETGMHLSADRVLDYCRKRLGFAQSPKVVIFGKDAPVNAAGKYQRELLREKFAAWQDTQFRQ